MRTRWIGPRAITRGAFGLALSAVTLVVAPVVQGFTLDRGLTNNTPGDPSDDLAGAARWSNVPGSLLNDGVRGLGGGIEYSIDDSICDELLPRFVDDPSPSCADLHAAVQSAFSRWAGPHPILAFTDVTGFIRPELPPPGSPQPWVGYGAEIDLLATNPLRYPAIRGFGAYTSFWYLNRAPMGTNGFRLTGVSMTSADIVFSTAVCYHVDPELTGRGCNHFESLVLHEIGHALGLDHPNQRAGNNFDDDEDPSNEMSINCRDPRQGLLLSSNIDATAVMNSSMGHPEPVHHGLSNDDVGARNFIFPVCADGGDSDATGEPAA